MPGEALAPLLHAGGVLGACGSRVSELAWRQRDKEAHLLRHLAGLLLGALGCGSRRCARLAGLLLRAFGRSGRGRARRRRRLFRAVYEPTDGAATQRVLLGRFGLLLHCRSPRRLLPPVAPEPSRSVARRTVWRGFVERPRRCSGGASILESSGWSCRGSCRRVGGELGAQPAWQPHDGWQGDSQGAGCSSDDRHCAPPPAPGRGMVYHG